MSRHQLEELKPTTGLSQHRRFTILIFGPFSTRMSTPITLSKDNQRINIQSENQLKRIKKREKYPRNPYRDMVVLWNQSRSQIHTIISELKSSTIKEDEPNIIYKINFTGCEKCYIEETRHLNPPTHSWTKISGEATWYKYIQMTMNMNSIK